MQEAAVKGKELQSAIIDLAHTHGWKVAHFQSVLATRKDGSASWRTPVAADGKGFPDLFMVRGADRLAIEVKGDGDKLRDDQYAWLKDLETAGIPSDVWGPREWKNGIIDKTLRYGPSF